MSIERSFVPCNGKDCPNGGVTSVFSDDTLIVHETFRSSKGKRRQRDVAYCSSCRSQVEREVR